LTAGEATRPVPRGAGISWRSVRVCSPSRKDEGDTYADGDGTTLPTLLRWQRMGITKIGTPISSSNRQDTKLGNDDGGADGRCDFFRCLDPQSNVTRRIANHDNGLESSALTSTGLLLDGFDLHEDGL